jgi:DNA-binding NarL/FixJ family response regulator
MIRVALVDDQAIVRAGLARILSPPDGFEVVAECVSGQEAIERLPALRPHVILMDVRMPDLDGIAATARLRCTAAGSPVLVLTTFGEDEVLWGAIEAGAAGFVLKDSSAEELIAAVRAVAGGGAWFDPGVAPRVLERYRGVVSPATRDAARLELLTDREHDVLCLMARARPTRDRQEPARRRGDCEDPRRQHLHQARRPRSRRDDRVRLRPWRGRSGAGIRPQSELNRVPWADAPRTART